MTDIRFYHLEQQTLEQALPALLSKALKNGHRIIVKTPNQKMTQHLNDHLWTHNPSSFLPHGSKKEGHEKDQPIWLTENEDNPNNADVLILTGGATSENINSFTLCCTLFDGRDEQALVQARSKWKTYQQGDYSLTYWQQGPNGWEKKAG